ncbi:hypothetical protein B0H19DRAFT_1147416 [Mycena capillaripes]|nr:hypothetical protein B0H19DRAFT_1147416 [Mycena capillaripes]
MCNHLQSWSRDGFLDLTLLLVWFLCLRSFRSFAHVITLLNFGFSWLKGGLLQWLVAHSSLYSDPLCVAGFLWIRFDSLTVILNLGLTSLTQLTPGAKLDTYQKTCCLCM